MTRELLLARGQSQGGDRVGELPLDEAPVPTQGTVRSVLCPCLPHRRFCTGRCDRLVSTANPNFRTEWLPCSSCCVGAGPQSVAALQLTVTLQRVLPLRLPLTERFAQVLCRFTCMLKEDAMLTSKL
jgi:hypothetical protein